MLFIPFSEADTQYSKMTQECSCIIVSYKNSGLKCTTDFSSQCPGFVLSTKYMLALNVPRPFFLGIYDSVASKKLHIKMNLYRSKTAEGHQLTDTFFDRS